MPIRPYRIQADFNPATGQVEEVTIFDCQVTTDPITDAEVVGQLVPRVCTAATHPELLAAINKELHPDKSSERIAESRAQFTSATERMKEAARIVVDREAKADKE